MTNAPLSKGELAEKFPEEDFASKLLAHLALSRILGESIIRRNYTIPDAINNALQFTDDGKEVIDTLIRKEKVEPKEARLVTYLTTVHVTPLIDMNAINLSDLTSSIGNEIKSKSILYPYIFGRDLYDRAAERFRDEREYLRHEDTLSLLEESQIGVFHVNHYLTGPYGLIDTGFERNIPPRTAVPLQHCPDPTCMRVHTVQLSTSSEARIVRSRTALNKVLQGIGSDASDWNGFLVDRTEKRDEAYDDRSMEGVPFLIGDALSEEELSKFFLYVLRNSSGRLIDRCSEAAENGSPSEIAERLSRAQKHQLLLTEDDKSLASCLDGAVSDGVLEIPSGEVRVLRVNRRHRSTAWGLRPQLSNLGFRSTTGNLHLANLRLSALVRELYDQQDPDDAAALRWLLRDSDELVGDQGNVEMAIDSLVRNTDPRTILKRFLFDRRENLERAGKSLAADFDQREAESTIISRALWKLGFRLPVAPSRASEYWETHRDFAQAARSAPAAPIKISSTLRAAGADQAVALEHYLRDALVFSWWMLLYDHYGASQQFVFRQNLVNEFSREQIAAAAARESYDGLEASAKLTLAPLTNGFGLLVRELEHREAAAQDFLRPVTARPRFAGYTSMQVFPFNHTIPYLDLDPSARENLKNTLREVTSRLSAAKIASIRNNILHATPSPPPPADILDALDDTGRALTKLEANGLTPQLFSLAEVRRRSWGRTVAEFRTESGEAIELHSPSHYEWLPTPIGDEQIIVRSATFGNGAEFLRFRSGHDSAYEIYWSMYPRRCEPSMSVGFDRSDTLASTVDGDKTIASRAD